MASAQEQTVASGNRLFRPFWERTMSRTALWDALSPIAARMPQVVREHEILRIAANITGKDPSKSADIARREVLKWAQLRSGGRLPANAWSYQDFDYFSGGRNSIGIRIESDATDIWAIRADDPDKLIAGRVWTTEVVVGLMGDQLPRFSARLLVSTPENNLDIEPHTPGFVQQVAESCGLSRGQYWVSAEPWLIDSDGEAERLLQMLIDQERRLPIFVLTVPEAAHDPHQPLLDASALARATLGTGHVAVLPASFTWALTQQFGKLRSVFGGAVRAYLPSFTADANPYAHRLVLADHVSTPDGVAQCIRWMRSLAATESVRRTVLGQEVLTFAAIRSASMELKQRRLEQEGASDSDQLAAAKARIDALEKQSKDQRATLDYFDAEHQIAEERAEVAEGQARAAAFRIQQLLDQIKASGAATEPSLELPQSWTDFANWCDVYLAGRVVLSPSARRGVQSPDFEDVEAAARCLLWLAHKGRNRRLEGGEGSLREENIEEGIRNSHCGKDQFDLNWQGQRQTADWHVKNGGNTRDPRRCMRIYYFWHAPTQQIVIAEMPAHRHTGAS
jgi:hypothetical protein